MSVWVRMVCGWKQFLSRSVPVWRFNRKLILCAFRYAYAPSGTGRQRKCSSVGKMSRNVWGANSIYCVSSSYLLSHCSHYRQREKYTWKGSKHTQLITVNHATSPRKQFKFFVSVLARGNPSSNCFGFRGDFEAILRHAMCVLWNSEWFKSKHDEHFS